jgi:hypothetical protein
VGILQAILQAMLRGAGPGGYCLQVLKGVLLAGHFVPGRWFLVPGYCACCLRGVLFLGVLFLVPGCCACYLRGVLFLGIEITGTGSPGSPRQLAPGVLVLGHCGY